LTGGGSWRVMELVGISWGSVACQGEVARGRWGDSSSVGSRGSSMLLRSFQGSGGREVRADFMMTLGEGISDKRS
jgi:hypothetical protein